MPTYVYGCDACGHRFERFQKFSDDPIRICPECQSSVRRIFQPAGIVFKGSGWHVTDYKRGGSNGSGAESSSDGETKAAGNGAAKHETKSADASSDSTTPTAKGDAAKSTKGDAAPAAKAAS